MAVLILHGPTAAALAVATSQQAQCEAVISAWAGGNVRARIYAGAVLLRTLTIGPWTINTSASPRKVVAAAGLADAAVAAGVQTRVVFELLDGTPILELSAGATASGADINWQYGQIRALCRPTMGVELVADAGLPAIDLPTWVAGADASTWVEIPMAATLADINPINNPLINPNHPLTPEWSANVNRQAAVVYAWCGAAYDEATDTMWLGIGGGHADYAGNEVYRCAFSVASPAWEMVRAPSGAVGNTLTTNDSHESTGLYSDGRPRATHTYNKWVYVPGVGAALACHGNGSWSGGNGKRWALFLDSDGEASFSSEATSYGINGGDGLAACYDASRHAMWFVPSGTEEVHRYDIPGSGGAQTGSFTTVGSAQARSGYISVGYMPTQDVLLIGNSNDGKTSSGWEVFDCATGTRYTPTFSGSAAIEAHTNGRCALRWVGGLGAFCTWNNATNTTQITRLTPGADPRTDTWTIDTLPVSGSNTVTPSACTTLGTYGRFAYSPTLGGFLVFNSTSGATYFYKV